MGGTRPKRRAPKQCTGRRQDGARGELGWARWSWGVEAEDFMAKIVGESVLPLPVDFACGVWHSA